MSIKFKQQGNLWTAKVTPPQGEWRSSHPMVIGHLIEALGSIGCKRTDIDRALREAAELKSQQYWNDEISPKLKAALAGEYEVPRQQRREEALLAYVLFEQVSPLSLRDIVDGADFVDHGPPNPDEVVWAFLQMRRRGWLAEKGDLYGLTAEGRRAIQSIVDEGDAWDKINRLKGWILSHPARGVG